MDQHRPIGARVEGRRDEGGVLPLLASDDLGGADLHQVGVGTDKELPDLGVANDQRPPALRGHGHVVLVRLDQHLDLV
jgi:hypothetical protein